ncbi:hypothetical protein NQ318_012766 [Aromia moschata]|uniref:Uncharacterized protein n=1 Tax=Aromia moschata TaxID=1265417 RepID=A0AAV8YHG7_9CUCU|nr:hypothetical protein NQ318_012766 [Aromia moschata]
MMVDFNIYLLLLLIYPSLISTEYYDLYECNTPLLEDNRAVLTATSSMNGRGPKNAILYGK